MNVRDPFFGRPFVAAIRPDAYGAVTTNGDFIDTFLRDEELAFILDVAAVVGTVTLTFEMAPEHPTVPDTPDTGAIVAVPAALIVRPQHTDAAPNAEPIIGSNLPAVAAANAFGAPHRVYIQPRLQTGTSGLLRFVRAVTVTSTSSKHSVTMFYHRMKRAGV